MRKLLAAWLPGVLATAIVVFSGMPDVLASQSAIRGGSGPQPVTIANEGVSGTVLEVSNISLVDDTHFSLIAGGTCSIPPFTLDGGDSCTQMVDFIPQGEGVHSTQLQVLSDAGSVVNDSVELSGTGIEGATPSISPDPLDFGLVDSGSLPATDSFTVSNIGDPTESFDITNLFLSGDPEFAIDSENCLGQTLFGGDSCNVTIEFEVVSNGSFSSQLTVQTTAGDTSAQIQGATQVPDRVVFVEQPTTTTVNAVIAPALVVQVQDSSGNLVGLDNNTVVELSFAVDPSGQAILGGVVSRQVSNGEAVFDDLTVDQAGTGFVLMAADSAGQLTAADSDPFNITPSNSTTSIIDIAPAGSQVVGQPYTVTVSVSGASPGGVVTVNEGTNSCQIDLDQAETSCQLVSNSVGSRTIAAFYPGDANNSSSDDTTSYDITQAAATVAIESISPPGSQAVNASYTVEVSVNGFNASGTVTVDDGMGATCIFVLPATSCALTSTSVGPRTITASYAGDVNNLPDSATAAYDIVAGAPELLVILVQPGNTISGQAIAPAVEVQVQDAFGNPVLDDHATQVSLVLLDGTPGAVLGGGDPLAVVAGEVSFANLTVDLAGSAYRLRAEAAGLQSVTSDPFDVGPGAPFELRFGAQPSTTLVNSPITPPVTVTVRDAAGNLVNTDNSTQVDLQLTGGTPGAVLGNGGVVTVTDGVATYASLQIDQTGLGYQLSADDFTGSLAGDLSNSFNIVSSASITQIVAFDPPGSQTVGLPYEVQVEVTGATPTGMVTVSDDLGAECQFDVGTDDRCSLISVGSGNRIITASYAGDENNASSSDQDFYVINPVQSELMIVSINPVDEQVINQPYQVQISLDGFNPTGQVIVDDGDGQVCLINLPGNSCSLTSNSIGPKTITAFYGGNANNLQDSDTADYEIVRASSTTSILGITPPGQQVVEVPYTVTVIVAGENPGGLITVSDGQGAECQIDIDLGQTACDLVSNTLGPRTITASYPGDINNHPSQATAPYQIVSTGPVALAFAIEPDYGVVEGPLFPRVVVHVVDSLGLQVADDNSTEVEIRFASNPGGAQLSGVVVKTVSGGVANFPELSINRLGEGYQLEARTPNLGLTADISAPFNIVSDQLLRDRFEAPDDGLFRDRFEF
jgi:hypothetical protein